MKIKTTITIPMKMVEQLEQNPSSDPRVKEVLDLFNSHVEKQTDGESTNLVIADIDAFAKELDVIYQRLFSPSSNDVVAVTRCKDCKHWKCDDPQTERMGGNVFCSITETQTSPNDYCSFAEKEEC